MNLLKFFTRETDDNGSGLKKRLGDVVYAASYDKNSIRVVLREHTKGFSRTTFAIRENVLPRYRVLTHAEWRK